MLVTGKPIQEEVHTCFLDLVELAFITSGASERNSCRTSICKTPPVQTQLLFALAGINPCCLMSQNPLWQCLEVAAMHMHLLYEALDPQTAIRIRASPRKPRLCMATLKHSLQAAVKSHSSPPKLSLVICDITAASLLAKTRIGLR